MSKPLSERLERLAGLTVESPAPHLTGDMKFYVYDAETREALSEAAALARRVEGAPRSDALVAGWLAKAAVYDKDRCNESDLRAAVLRDCASELTYPNGTPCALVPVEGGA